jgi:hypothetical protein
MMLATRELSFLGISERGIFTLNELYTLGGSQMVDLYEWWNQIEFARPVKIYLQSLGAIIFQYNTFAGIADCHRAADQFKNCIQPIASWLLHGLLFLPVYRGSDF